MSAGETRVSEYEVLPQSAPLFLVGEAWAELHLRDRRLAELRRNELSVGAAATVIPLPEGRRLSPLEFEPEVLARDLVQALGEYTPGDARAILAGYARVAYEAFDHRSLGITDEILDRLHVAEQRPRPQGPPFDVPRLWRALGLRLEARNFEVVAFPVSAQGPNPWNDEPKAAFLAVLALLVAGVDCRALFNPLSVAHRQGSESVLYQILRPDYRIGPDPEAEYTRMREHASGIELAVGLSQVLRNSALAEPFDFNEVLFWVRRVLVSNSDQTGPLGDLLIDTAWRCAQLVAGATGDARGAERYAQKAIIVGEYIARGGEDDESRFVRLWRELRALGWSTGKYEGPGDLSRLGIMNSLLLTQRALAEASVTAQKNGRPGTLRSAALRGVHLAREGLRFAYSASSSRDPEVAAPAFPFLRLTIKNYARLLFSLHEMAEVEQKATRASAWLTFFEFELTPTLLTRELAWIAEAFETAAQEGFSLDQARAIMREAPRESIDSTNVHREPPS